MEPVPTCLTPQFVTVAQANWIGGPPRRSQTSFNLSGTTLNILISVTKTRHKPIDARRLKCSIWEPGCPGGRRRTGHPHTWQKARHGELPQSHHASPLGRCSGQRLGQEASMARTATVTPCVQTARPREKTFTRHPLDTLRSHPSCISARCAPSTNGAADVSGR